MSRERIVPRARARRVIAWVRLLRAEWIQDRGRGRVERIIRRAGGPRGQARDAAQILELQGKIQRASRFRDFDRWPDPGRLRPNWQSRNLRRPASSDR